MSKQWSLLCGFLLSINAAQAAEISVPINNTQTQQPIGTVVFSETPYGLLITPNLTNLSQGLHGFHLHQHPKSYCQIWCMPIRRPLCLTAH